MEMIMYTFIIHSTTNFVVGGLVIESIIPKSSIQSSQSFKCLPLVTCWFPHNQADKVMHIHQRYTQLYTKLMDWTGDWCHHVTLVRIQHKQWNNIFCCCNEWFENFSTHSSIAPSSMHSTDKSTHSQLKRLEIFFVAILPFWIPLKINIGGKFVPSAHTITTRVAHLASCVEV